TARLAENLDAAALPFLGADLLERDRVVPIGRLLALDLEDLARRSSGGQDFTVAVLAKTLPHHLASESILQRVRRDRRRRRQALGLPSGRLGADALWKMAEKKLAEWLSEVGKNDPRRRNVQNILLTLRTVVGRKAK